MIDKIEQLSSKHTPFRVLISDLSFSVYPVGINLENVRLFPNKTLENNLEPIHLKKLGIGVSLLNMFSGHFQISEINFTEPTVVIKSFDFPKDDKAKAFILTDYLKLPVSNLNINNLNLKISEYKDIPNINVSHFSMELENRQTAALLSFLSPQITLSHSKYANEVVDFGLGSRILLSEDQIYLSALKIKQNSSYLLATGNFDMNLANMYLKKAQIKTKMFLDLGQISKQASKIFSDQKIPKVSGHLATSLIFKKEQQSLPYITSQVVGRNLKINQFIIGNIKSLVNYQDNQLNINNLKIENSSGKIELHNAKMQLHDNYNYQTEIHFKDIQLQNFLENIGVIANAQLLINTTLPCQGSFIKEPFLQCTGKMNLENLRVYNNENDIVTFNKGEINGQLEVLKNGVRTSGALRIGENSFGSASGFVHYTNGFDFKYNAQKLNFSDIKISSLDLEGTSSLSGTTKGDGHAAVFGFNIATDNFWIKNYGIGKVKCDVSYLKGTLFLKDVFGLFRTTKFTGNVDVNLNKNEIVSNLQLPYIELSDVQKIFERKVTLPFEVYGGGSAQVNLKGPIDFSLLSYDFKSRFLQGRIANETFDEVIFDVLSKNGNVSVKQGILKKNLGVMTLTGKASPDGQIQTQWFGKNFAVQDFYLISKSEINLSSHFDFNLSLMGHIFHPNSIFKAKLSNTQIAQEPFEDSEFELSFKKNQVMGSTQLFGNTISGNFSIPFDADYPFKLQLKTNNWNFAPLLTMISNQNLSAEFSTELSSTISLESQKNWLWESNGKVDISNFKLRRGTKELFTPKPISLQFSSGKMKINSFSLRGDNTFLEATTLDNKKNKIGFAINGKMDLSLLSFLTPFLSDLKGIVAISSQVRADPNYFSIIGSSFVEDGYAKLTALPHAFENFNLDVLFSENKILINKFTSQFANGKINASGNIEIKGFKNFPTILNGTFNNVKLKMPTNYDTEGSGDFRIIGNWFPYKFSGNYNISDGVISKKFETQTDENIVQRSALLPEFLQKKESKVLEFDFNTRFPRGVQISNELVDAKATGDLNISGTPDSPILSGQVNMTKGGLLYFRDVPFQIKTANFNFNNPKKNNPELFIEANTVIEEKTSSHSYTYEVNLTIQGTADNPVINLISNPPLANKEILSLLALGMTSESMQDTTQGRGQFYQQSAQIGTSILTQNTFGKQLKRKTGLDIKFSPTIDQTTNTAASKITISKQWTPHVGTSVSRTFGDLVSQDVKLEYKLNKNVSLVGSWETKEAVPNQSNVLQQKNAETSILGLDIIYKVEYK